MIKYKSNNGRVGDGTRITRIKTINGIQTFSIMVDEKTERYSDLKGSIDTGTTQPAPVVPTPVNPVPVQPVDPTPAPTPTPIPPVNPPLVTGQTINDSASLQAVLSNATGGEIFYLGNGNFGKLNISKQFPKTVTIDGQNQAKISGLNIRNSKNLILKNFVVQYNFAPGDVEWKRLLNVISSSYIDLVGFSATGSNAYGTGKVIRDGFPAGQAFFIQRSNNVNITDHVIRNWSVGVAIDNSSFVNILRNDIRIIGHDGIQFAECTDCEVSDNRIEEFYWHPNDGNHPDCIQFWSNKNPIFWHNNFKCNRNICNTINSTTGVSGDWMQGILGRQVKNGEFRDNQINVLHWNALQLAVTSGFIIDGNIVTKQGDTTRPNNVSPVMTPRIDLTKVGSATGTITNNQTPTPILGIKPGWIVSNNT